VSLEIWSGGQTGVDRAALDAARELGMRIGGWIPHGRLAEDGVVPNAYVELREAEAPGYGVRTERNVHDTDATLVLRWGEATGGTRETIACAARLGRPVLEVDLDATPIDTGAESIRNWLRSLSGICRLNVAGPRASQAPEGYAKAKSMLRFALSGGAAVARRGDAAPSAGV
jgi:hypothetical protein